MEQDEERNDVAKTQVEKLVGLAEHQKGSAVIRTVIDRKKMEQ